MKRKYLYYFLPLLGTLFGLWYIFQASCDGIYSDYIRLVNSYLPDIYNPDKFFVPDILTRIPLNYLGRIVNVVFFGYNTMFDRVLGVLALGLSGMVIASYSLRQKVSAFWFAVVMAVLFSLNKWEMLTNGSGWTHFLSFACFYYHYEVLDREWNGKGKPYDSLRLVALPFATTLLVAGPYCAIYSVTIIGTCGILFLLKKGKGKLNYALYGISGLIPLLLYLWSDSYVVVDHADYAGTSLLEQLKDTPGFFARFFIKSFSSMIIEGERAEEIFHRNLPFIIMGLLVIVIYILALWYNWKYRLYKKTLFPAILLVSGGLNHVLILFSRWFFLRENYGMSSRYALQFQTGIIGILLTFALVLAKEKKRQHLFLRLAAGGSCILFLTGNIYTTYVEIKKAPYRLEAYEKRAKLARDFEQLTDKELRDNFEYRKYREDSGEKVRSALSILKENGYSIFHE